MKSFLVIGLGHFGQHLVKSLAKFNCEIMIADKDESRVEEMMGYSVSAKIGDCTNIEVLKTFDIPSFDTCFVCMGENFQNSLEITSLLKDCGAKKVITKADRDIQEKFLLKNGADAVIYPDKNMAERYAVRESSKHIFDYINLDNDYSIYEIPILHQWIGKSIVDIDVRNKYRINIIAVKNEDGIQPMPGANYSFKPDDHIIVIGKSSDVFKISDRI